MVSKEFKLRSRGESELPTTSSSDLPILVDFE